MFRSSCNHFASRYLIVAFACVFPSIIVGCGSSPPPAPPVSPAAAAHAAPPSAAPAAHGVPAAHGAHGAHGQSQNSTTSSMPTNMTPNPTGQHAQSSSSTMPNAAHNPSTMATQAHGQSGPTSAHGQMSSSSAHGQQSAAPASAPAGSAPAGGSADAAAMMAKQHAQSAPSSAPAGGGSDASAMAHAQSPMGNMPANMMTGASAPGTMQLPGSPQMGGSGQMKGLISALGGPEAKMLIATAAAAPGQPSPTSGATLGAGGQAPKFPDGSAEDVLLKFCIAMADDNLTAAAEYISPKAKGVLIQIRDGSITDEKLGEMKPSMALSDLKLNSASNTGGGRSIYLANSKNEIIGFTFFKELDVYKLRELRIKTIKPGSNFDAFNN